VDLEGKFENQGRVQHLELVNLHQEGLKGLESMLVLVLVIESEILLKVGLHVEFFCLRVQLIGYV